MKWIKQKKKKKKKNLSYIYSWGFHKIVLCLYKQHAHVFPLCASIPFMWFKMLEPF